MTLMATDDLGKTGQAIRPGRHQTVAIGAASAQSTVFADSTTIVDVTADVDCFLAIGPNPTATSVLTPLWAKTYRALRVSQGDKIAVIQSAAAGTLYIGEGT